MTNLCSFIGDTAMHPADIQAALKKAGSNQLSIAKRCEVTPSTVAHVIQGRGKSRKVANAIASVVKKPLSELWPGKYD